MKSDIHPKYYDKVKAKCACSAQFVLGSTLEQIEVEICSQCHPFYTGSEKIIDKGGRVEKFKQRRAAALEAKKKTTTKSKTTTKKSQVKKSIKDLIKKDA